MKNCKSKKNNYHQLRKVIREIYQTLIVVITGRSRGSTGVFLGILLTFQIVVFHAVRFSGDLEDSINVGTNGK